MVPPTYTTPTHRVHVCIWRCEVPHPQDKDIVGVLLHTVLRVYTGTVLPYVRVYSTCMLYLRYHPVRRYLGYGMLLHSYAWYA